MRKVRTSKVLARYGDWVVTTYGIENTTNYYPIERRRVHDADWVEQIAGKRWADVDTFKEALQDAIARWSL